LKVSEELLSQNRLQHFLILFDQVRGQRWVLAFFGPVLFPLNIPSSELFVGVSTKMSNFKLGNRDIFRSRTGAACM